MRLDRENRIAEVRCTLPKLYRKKDLYELEGEIARTYELAQMRILPRYPEDLFTTDYMSEILTEAARVGVVINGFFNRYELETEEDMLRRFQEIIKEENPDALFIGEVWEDASNKEAYGVRRRYFVDGTLD